MADGSPVGVFTDNGDDQKLSSCTPEVITQHGSTGYIYRDGTGCPALSV